MKLDIDHIVNQIKETKGKMKHNKSRVLLFLVIFISVAIALEIFILMLLTRMNEEKTGFMTLERVVSVVNGNADREADMISGLKKDYLKRASSMAYLLEKNPSWIKDTTELRKLAEIMNVEEIHLFDQNGKLYSGTHPSYYGMTFDSGPQMSYFKPMVKDRQLSMCQDLTPNDAEGRPMVYAITWTKSGRFMVQVGIEPKRFLSTKKEHEIPTVIANLSEYPGIKIYVYDKETGIIVGATDKQLMGKDITSLGLPAATNTTSGFTMTDGTICYYTCKTAGQYMAMVTSINMMERQRSNTALIVETIYLLLAGLLIFYTVKRLIDSNIKTVNQQSELIEEIASLNKELEKAKEVAEAASSAKTTFLFNMSHDIRTPMNAIIGFQELLKRHQDDPVKRADYLQKIATSSHVLLSIINNVLEMARIEKGTLPIEELACNAEQFNDSLVSIFQETMQQKGLHFTHQVSIQHKYFFGDANKLREIYINILSNAFKYTNAGGSINMNLKEIPSERPDYVVYQTTISDNGIGMSEDFLPHVFEEFSREHNTTHNKIEGTGLGMPIVKRLVELMGGTITVESKQGAGSTFTVTMRHRKADQSNLEQIAGVEVDPALFKGKRILLAEDNKLNAEIAIEILSEAGFLVEHASDGRICCQMLSDAPDNYYDLILMDVQMPNMNGYEATETIRAMQDSAKATLPILAMTANAFAEDKQNAYRAGMNGHIAKPIDVTVLMRELSNALG